jgi:alpha-1,4-digalacturonate transport system permease protein
VTVMKALTRTRDRHRLGLTDWLSYGFLMLGVVLMLGPALWLASSSLKTKTALQEFPPSFWPTGQKEVRVAGSNAPLPVYLVAQSDGSSREMALSRRVGLMGLFIDPAQPGAEPLRASIDKARPVREITLAWENYTDPLKRLRFDRYLTNSVVVTITATLLTLLVNSMCAFALSKYRFRGRNAIFVLILSTLMVPVSVILIPSFLVITSLGLTNSLWGVILPPVATPTGVFLLRQYMLTIPDELIDAARMDGASEWRIYWRIVMPLAIPALAVLGIFSVMWRWNDFLWPLIVLNREEVFTLQLGLASFQGELDTQWHYLLAMTVLTLAPVVLIFTFLQKYITTGIASSGLK